MLFWWTMLHFGAWYDALILEDLWLWCATLGGWWHGDFDDGRLALVMIWLLWLMTWRLCFDDDLVLWLMEIWLGWCLGWWRFWYVDDLETVLFYILPVSWSLPHLRVGFLKPLLVGSKRTLDGSSTKSWISYFSWSRMIWEDWSLPHWHYCIKWFLSIYYWVFHSYLVSIFYVIDLLLWCIMFNQCCL